MGWITEFYSALRRRRVLRVAALYVVGGWVAIQVASEAFPALDILETAIRFVWLAVFLGFPLALIFGWRYDITAQGIVRTPPGDASKTVDISLHRTDYIILGALAAVVAAISYGLIGGILETETSRRPQALFGDIPAKSIAVLPFDNLSADSESTQYFVAGVHADLITQLTKLGSLDRVIARSSVEHYRGIDKTSSEIATELGVRWIIEGTVQHVGEQVRVSGSLIDPVRGVQAWSDSYLYDLSAANLFAIQAEITQQIADALHTRLTPEEKRNVGAHPTDNLDAYRLVVKARTLLVQKEEPQMRRALALFRQATDIDPKFALAWVGLANSLYELVDYGFEMPEDSVEQAMRAAEHALQLDPDSPEALVSLGVIRYLQQDGLESMRHLEQAIALRPAYAEAFSKVSWVAQILGRPGLAAESAETSIQLDPLAPETRANYALTRLLQGDGQLALTTLQTESELVQDWTTSRFYEGVVLYHLGRYEDAVGVLNGLSIPWAGLGPMATEALAHIASGNVDAAASLLSAMEESGAHPFLVGLVYAGLGDQATAFRLFESVDSWSIDADWPILAARYLYPDVLDSMRLDPRYDRMLRAIDRAWSMVM